MKSNWIIECGFQPQLFPHCMWYSCARRMANWYEFCLCSIALGTQSGRRVRWTWKMRKPICCAVQSSPLQLEPVFPPTMWVSCVWSMIMRLWFVERTRRWLMCDVTWRDDEIYWIYRSRIRNWFVNWFVWLVFVWIILARIRKRKQKKTKENMQIRSMNCGDTGRRLPTAGMGRLATGPSVSRVRLPLVWFHRK